MKKVVLMAIIGVGATMMLSGCGKSAVECDDSDAQKTVMELAEGEIKNQIAAMARLSYSGLKQSTNADDQKTVETIDKQYSEAAPTLANIRTDSMNNELEKSECAAEISYNNGNKTNITYKLSKTSDGTLYAEVFGLR